MWLRKNKVHILATVVVCLVIYSCWRMFGSQSDKSHTVKKLQKAIEEHDRQHRPRDPDTARGRNSGMLPIDEAKAMFDQLKRNNSFVNKLAVNAANSTGSDSLKINADSKLTPFGALDPNRNKTTGKTSEKSTSGQRKANVDSRILKGVGKSSLNTVSKQRADTVGHHKHNVREFSTCVNVYNMTNKTNILHSKRTCVFMNIGFGKTPVCIHDPKTDKISASLFVNTTWQPGLVTRVTNILNGKRDMVFVDVGCNIGVFTILAARLGHRVIAVDPMVSNLQLLAEALKLARLRQNVTLIHNVLSHVHEDGTFTVNKTTTFVDNKITTLINKNVTSKNVTVVGKAVVTKQLYTEDDRCKGKPSAKITLDDLQRPLIGKTVFMRLDLGNSGLAILKSARAFFKAVNVRYLVMDWRPYRKRGLGQEVIDIMTELRMKAETESSHLLDQDQPDIWPDNVIWRRELR